MINWREKFLATAIHFGVTLVLAGLAAALIFLVWFPHPMATMIGGTELFLLVVGCDLALGPLLSLVVYNSNKTRRALIVDYSVVGVLQVAALVYGVTVVAGTRPVYVAFSVDRYEIVTAREIADSELAAARDPRYATLPWTGARMISIVVPKAERSDAMFAALDGNEEHQRPRYYAPLEDQLEAIRKRARPIANLEKRKPASKPLLDEAMAGVRIPAERLRWLPAHHRNGFWTALIDTADGKPVAWVDLDPY